MSRSAYRNHPTWWAFAIHRGSGVALAAFLPAHFWALGLALESEAALDSLLAWTAHPALK
ncbi:MAG: succinate dehydrogenase, partial [Rhodospirillales bacterium]